MNRVCLAPGCAGAAQYRGRCSVHSRHRERETHPNKAFYNSRRWKMARRRQLFEESLCEVCGDIATDVDHRTPIERGGAKTDSANLSSLCHAHHSQKTRREMGSP